MVGITSYGAYIPLQRINRKIIFNATGWSTSATSLPGEKAVANYDEDSVTMAVAASIDCLTSTDRNKVGGLYFATTTPPYRERQSAGIIATALDLRPDIRACRFHAIPLKAGTRRFACCLRCCKGRLGEECPGLRLGLPSGQGRAAPRRSSSGRAAQP